VKDPKNKWVVIHDTVYNIAEFSRKHPGGERLMMNHVHEDASDAFVAFHKDMPLVAKYMKAIEVGKIVKSESKELLEAKKQDTLMEDFRKLRETAVKMGCFETNFLFFLLHFSQLIALDALAVYTIAHYGSSWLGYLAAAVMLTTVQAQASWLQHDFGHLSVFKKSSLNHLAQRVVLSVLKGYSFEWWNFRHYQHHAKPNVVRKDPDIRFGSLFVLGKVIPRELGKKKVGKYPYTMQQLYFFLVMPPLLMPLYFTFEQLYFMFGRKFWKDIAWVTPFFVGWMLAFSPYMGLFGALRFYFFVKFLESHWFVWTTQMNHLPMNIDRESYLDWVRLQLGSTCNVESSFFNDWFTGHLNYQIEHHLFPTMPRHNYHKIAPLVRSMCEKYNVQYIEKSLSGAMSDIFWSLKQSGELWYEAYNM
jgi:fatty acid desaturase 2 (delta-6 desaturase)